MSVGFSQDRTAIDNRAGSLSAQTRDLLTQIQHFQLFLSGKSDADLMNMPNGYTQDEVTLLKSAILALDQLRLVAQGQATQSAENNFLFFSNQLTGTS